MIWGIVFLGVDQLVKFWLLRYLPEVILINPGIAFGVGNTAWVLGLVLVGILLVGWLYFSSQDRIERLLLAVVLGGSLSNLIDRITRGGVVDYLKIPHLSSFNLADVGVIVGIGLLIFRYLSLSRSSR